MSAFIVSKKHIDEILRAAVALNLCRTSCDINGEPITTDLTVDACSALGKVLWRENAKSVAARYDEPLDDQWVHYEFSPVLKSSLPFNEHVQAVKYIDCLKYQSCEHEEWPESEAYAFLASFRATLVDLILRKAGYDAAQWSAD